MSLPPSERDIARLRDMLDHAELALAHVQGLDEAGFRESLPKLIAQLHAILPSAG